MSKEKLRTGTWLLAVAAGAVLAGATVANATPIRFDNPTGEDHFVWYGEPLGSPIGLDITLDAASQTGDWSAAATQFAHGGGGISAQVLAGSGAELQCGGTGDYFLLGVDGDVSIPSGVAWDDDGYTYYSGYDTPLPEGEPTYLGVHFELGDGTHYGWIGVTRFDTLWLDAFAWGYNDEPGQPIAAGAPEPGTLALLAIGAVGALRRRR